MRHGLEELGRREHEGLWEGGLELRSDATAPTPIFRLLLGGLRVGTLRIERGLARIEAEASWAEHLLHEVFEEWRHGAGPVEAATGA